MSRPDNNQRLQRLNHDIAVSSDNHVENKESEHSLDQSDNIDQGRNDVQISERLGTDCPQMAIVHMNHPHLPRKTPREPILILRLRRRTPMASKITKRGSLCPSPMETLRIPTIGERYGHLPPHNAEPQLILPSRGRRYTSYSLAL